MPGNWGVLLGALWGPSLGLPAHPDSLQAREMTLQAMALQQQPLSPTPRPFPPEVSLALHECCVAPGHCCTSLNQEPPPPLLGQRGVPESRLM